MKILRIVTRFNAALAGLNDLKSAGYKITFDTHSTLTIAASWNATAEHDEWTVEFQFAKWFGSYCSAFTGAQGKTCKIANESKIAISTVVTAINKHCNCAPTSNNVVYGCQ
eukprot:TRINITY_DN21016_c0_g1_i1.p1 TRINITY_DN21016_c0_g1~~TRINITY_DN21016_c0_g1_i1.p1  ORF type:complete len:111 (+),score=14.49 TRINITY_DN21016_c0_g1_i1:225-557(+)